MPYADTSYNRASFPLQPLEYLAAGRPVVTTPIESMSWLAAHHDPDGADGRPCLTVDDFALVRTPDDFADRVEKLFVVGRDEASMARRRAVAESHSWRNRISLLADALGLPAEPHRPMETVTP